MTTMFDHGPFVAETDNGAGGFADADGFAGGFAPADLGAHGLPRAGGSADNDEIESGGRDAHRELSMIQEPGQSGGGKLDGLGGTRTAPAGAAAVPQALHLPYRNGTAVSMSRRLQAFRRLF